MSFSISSFTNELQFDGARPTLFQVLLSFPASVVTGGTIAGQKMSMMARATSLPSSRLGIIQIPYFGRQVKVPGNVTYDDWTITIINDEDFIVRNAFESWHNLINSHAGNLRDQSMADSSGYAVNASVLQFGKTGDVIKQYDFVGLFPIDVTPITVDWGSTDTIEQFDVTLACQYWTSTFPVPTTDF